VPALAETRFDRQQRALLPVGQKLDMFDELRLDCGDAAAQFVESGRAQVLITAFWKHIAYLPVVEAIEHNQNVATAEAAKHTGRFPRIFRQAWQAKPKHVHRRRGRHRLNAQQKPYARKTAVGADCQRCAHFVPPIEPEKAHAAYHAIFLDERLHVAVHDQPETRELLRLSDDELQKTRLWHEHDVREFSLDVS